MFRETPDRIVELANTFRKARVLLSAVELGVFAALRDGPLDRESLRQRVGIHDRGARDFFDALVALDLMGRDAAGNYKNNPSSELFLVPGRPSYIGGLLNYLGAREYASWSGLTAALRTGRAQFGNGTAGPYCDLYAAPAAMKEFAAAMTGGTLLAARALAQKFPWDSYRTFVDVGAAEGCLPVEVARAHPHLEGGGFDLPALADRFDSYVRRHHLSNRLRFYPGDFMRHALPTADVLVMGRVLHNWDVPTRQMLLHKAYSALPTNGVLIVYERLIDDDRRASATGLLGSLNMLIMTAGGSDYSAEECGQWMRGVGFRDMRVEVLTTDQTALIALK